MSNIIRNALQTPDGTVIESRSVHDYQTHIDANGKEYMVDGGLDYIRRSANGDEIDLTVTIDDPHEVVREALTWGTYGPNGDQPLKYVKLCDMEADHIRACLKNVQGMYPQFRAAMENELKHRSGTLLDMFSELGESMAEARKEYEGKLELWWQGLSQQEREDAFYAVIKRMHGAEVKDRGSYRYALYDVFDFDESMYGRGMDCGYMDLHNIIYDGIDYGKMKRVDRIEVIDHRQTGAGRELVKYLNKGDQIEFDLQDDDRTLKIFIGGNKENDNDFAWPACDVAGP